MITLYRSLRPHLFFVVLFCLTLALVAGIASKKQEGPHGGALQGVENYFIEMKHVDTPGQSVPQKLFAYLLDKKMKGISNKETSAEVLFHFPDNTSNSVPMKPELDDAFTCEVPARYVTCKITFSREGKLLSARFNNPLTVAKNK